MLELVVLLVAEGAAMIGGWSKDKCCKNVKFLFFDALSATPVKQRVVGGGGCRDLDVWNFLESPR